MDGWIKLYRSIRDHWIFKDPERFRAWIIILLEVNHSYQRVIIRGEVYECDIGQSLLSYDSWAARFGKGWTKQKVRTFFSLLEKDEMLTHEGLHYTTRISVCNYKSYQIENASKQHTDNTPNNTPITRRQHADNTPITPNKNDKNDNNGKNDKNNTYRVRKMFIPPTLEEIKQFCKEKGYKFFDCATYFELRDGCGWENSKGRKIVNWKNDIITAQSFNNFQRKKTAEELEKEQWDEMNAFCDELSKQVL